MVSYGAQPPHVRVRVSYLTLTLTLALTLTKAVVFFPMLIALLQLLLISFTTLTLVGMYTDPAASYGSQLTAVKQTYASALEDASSTAGGLGNPHPRPHPHPDPKHP